MTKGNSISKNLKFSKALILMQLMSSFRGSYIGILISCEVMDADLFSYKPADDSIQTLLSHLLAFCCVYIMCLLL